MSSSETDAFDMMLLGTLDPDEIYQHCLKTGPNKIAEKYIVKGIGGPRRAMEYACNVLKERFPLGEELLFSSTSYHYCAIKYFHCVGKEENKDFEDFLIRYGNVHEILNYCKRFKKGRWPEAEEHIKEDPQNSYFYARHIKERFLAGEKAIATSETANEYYQELFGIDCKALVENQKLC